VNICCILSGVAVFALAGGTLAFSQDVVLLFDDTEPPIAVPDPLPDTADNPVVRPPALVPEAWGWGGQPNEGDLFISPPYPGFPYEPFADPYASLKPCPWWRPCGPANSFGRNWLFYQGAYGADFRSACQSHDDCLMNPYNSRYGCDRAFYESMAAECANSANPAACLCKAKMYYAGVRLFGGFVRAGAP